MVIDEARFAAVRDWNAWLRSANADDFGTPNPLEVTMAETLTRLVPGEWNIVLGIELARSLGVRDGDKVTLVAPGGQVTYHGPYVPLQGQEMSEAYRSVLNISTTVKARSSPACCSTSRREG